jgi:DDE_Tnp_1-associated
MPASHASAAVVTSTDGKEAGKVPGLQEVLAQVPDPRKRRGRRYVLVFVLAVAVACVLAGAKSFREIGDQAADLLQEILARLGGKPHPLLRRIIAPSEKRVRTLIHAIGAEILDDLIGGWLRALADTGRQGGLLTAIAIDGKWLRGVADGQVKLFAAMLHENKVVIAQHRIPDETTETTQLKELLEPVDLEGAVVTADAAHAQRRPRTASSARKRTGTAGRTTSCSSRPTGRPCTRPSSTPSSTTAPASRTTRNWTTATAGSSAAPSGSPMPAAWTSRMSPGSRGSAATATTSTAP